MKQELTDECLRDLARPHFSKGYNDQIFDVVGFGRELLADKDAEIAALRSTLVKLCDHHGKRTSGQIDADWNAARALLAQAAQR